MAITQILPVNDTEATSGDTVIAAGSSVSFALKDAAGPDINAGAAVQIQMKDDAGQYFTIATLRAGKPSLLVDGPATVRVRRLAGVACGVFSG